MNRKSVIVMMLVPSAISIIIGVALVFVTTSPKTSDDQSGLGYLINTLLLGALFSISVIINLVFLINGSVQLRKLRNK